MGLHLCLFQTLKVLSFKRYTQFQYFNPIFEGFLIVFFLSTPLRMSNVAAGGMFSASKIFLETREKKKSDRRLYQENRVDVLENSHPVL